MQPQINTTPNMQPAVDASQLASPANVISPEPSANEMADGGDVAPETKNDGSVDFGQTIAIGLVVLTLVSLFMNIYVQRKQLLKLDKDDSNMMKTMNELKYNLKAVRGDKYESLAD